VRRGGGGGGGTAERRGGGSPWRPSREERSQWLRASRPRLSDVSTRSAVPCSSPGVQEVTFAVVLVQCRECHVARRWRGGARRGRAGAARAGAHDGCTGSRGPMLGDLASGALSADSVAAAPGPRHVQRTAARLMRSIAQ